MGAAVLIGAGALPASAAPIVASDPAALLTSSSSTPVIAPALQEENGTTSTSFSLICEQFGQLLPELCRPNLTVTKTPASDTVEPGGTIVWTITVRNTGGAEAEIDGWLIRDIWGEGLSNIGMTAVPEGYDCLANGDLVCGPTEGDVILPGQTRTFTFEAQAPQEGRRF